MAISGSYYIKMWLPNPALVHGPDFQAGPPAGDPPPGDAGGPPPAAPKPQVSLKDYGQPGENFFEGDITLNLTANPDGTLSGGADGTPINFGFYTGDAYFKVDFPAGPGRWEIWAKVDPEGYVEGMISVGGNKGFPNLVYGRKIG